MERSLHQVTVRERSDWAGVQDQVDEEAYYAWLEATDSVFAQCDDLLHRQVIRKTGNVEAKMAIREQEQWESLADSEGPSDSEVSGYDTDGHYIPAGWGSIRHGFVVPVGLLS